MQDRKDWYAVRDLLSITLRAAASHVLKFGLLTTAKARRYFQSGNNNNNLNFYIALNPEIQIKALHNTNLHKKVKYKIKIYKNIHVILVFPQLGWNSFVLYFSKPYV